MIFGSVPIGTKIYLEDKSLANIESLSIGDRVLSLELKDNEIKKPLDFYLKYVNSNVPIKKSDLSFSYAVISNINVLKNEKSSFSYDQYMYINNPIVANFENNEIYLWHAKSKNFERKEITIEKYNNIDNFVKFKIPSYPDGFIENILNENNTIEKTNMSEFNSSPYFSISLKNNYFYFTDQLCLLGIVPEIIGDFI